MSKTTDFKKRHLAATEARVHFGELVDDVADGLRIAEVERSDGYTVVVEPAAETGAEATGFDAKAWLANLDRIQARIRAWRIANGITERDMEESTVEIIRELRDSR